MASNKSGPTYIYDSDDEIKHLQLQIGSKLYPNVSLGVQANNLHSLDVKGYEYRNHKFVVGFDTEQNARAGLYRNTY